MINVVGVRFQNTGKSYYFDPLAFELKRGMHVIVETQRGKEFGTVTIPPILVQDDKVVQPLRPILRIATQEDEQRNEDNRERSIEAGKICVEKIAKYGLEMKLVDTEYTFDRSKLLFYFTADGRVDFRELVKDLASVFRTRIELRQIGVRDETKIKGGLGICGRELCCTTFLSDFAPVSIRMAKEQNLSLNPSKISGACGRLMCCLKNEQETYEYLNKQLPKVGQHVRTIDGNEGNVHSVNILKQTVKVMLDQNGEKELREYAGGELAYGNRDFTCEPRTGREDDLDYFSEQLKRAVAAAQGNEEAARARDGKSRSKNRGSRGRSSQSSRGGDRRQGPDRGQQDGGSKTGERAQGSSRRQRDRQQGEQRRQRDGQQGERRRQRDAQQGEQHRQNSDGRRGGNSNNSNDSSNQNNGSMNSRRRGENRRSQDAGTREDRQTSRRQSSRNPDTAGKNDAKQNSAGEENRSRSRDRQEKSGRNRNRNRSRGNKNREAKQQQGDTAGAKQSDS